MSKDDICCGTVDSAEAIDSRIQAIALRLLEGHARFDKLYDALADNGVCLDIDFGMFEAALDLLGVPEDNTIETNACDVYTKTGKWPDGAYCRDWTFHTWTDDCKKDPRAFIAFVLDMKIKQPKKGARKCRQR